MNHITPSDLVHIGLEHRRYQQVMRKLPSTIDFHLGEIPLLHLVNSLPLLTTMWVMHQLPGKTHVPEAFLLKCADMALDVYEHRFPEDKKPREGLNVAKTLDSQKTKAWLQANYRHPRHPCPEPARSHIADAARAVYRTIDAIQGDGSLYAKAAYDVYVLTEAAIRDDVMRIGELQSALKECFK